MNKLYYLLPGISILLAMTSCRRETRHFEGGQPSSLQAGDRRLIDLQPGSQQPNLPMKNPFDENAFALSEGKRLYASFNCKSCHANGGGDIGPPLMDAKWIYGAAPENIYASIVEGRPNGMPSYRGHITEQQVWELVAYVRSLSGQVPQAAAPSRGDNMQAAPPENSMKREDPNSATLPKSSERPGS